MKRIALILGLGLGLAAGGCQWRGWISSEPPVHLNPNMDTQEKGKPFRHDQSGVFADGRYMQTPPPGTIPRGYLEADDQMALGIDKDGKPLTHLPDAFQADTNTVARGKNRFLIYCAPCHGKDADGKGLVAARPNALAVPPPSFLDPRLVSMPVGQMYKAIHDGVNNLNMPSYAVQIPESDRWAILAYLCTVQTGVADPMKACSGENKKPQAAKGPGDQVAIAHGCYACHTTDGSPKIGPSWKGIYGTQVQTDKGTVTIDDAYITESIQNPTAKIVNGFPPVMPPQQLTPQELKDVIDWIKSLK